MTDVISVCVDSNNCSNGCSTCLEMCVSALGSIPYIFCSLKPCFCCDQDNAKVVKYEEVKTPTVLPTQKEMSRVEIHF